jgi:predicted TIM-barrel fold metal-dependent hydrolase
MVVDAHYHYYQLPADEKAAKEFVAWQLRIGERASGIHVDTGDAMPLARDIADDGACEKLIRRMDRCGVDATVLLAVDIIERAMSDEEVIEMNAECARAAALHPDRTIAIASVDPRRSDGPALFRHCIEKLGMKGLKWQPHEGFYVNGKEAYRILKVLDEYGLPLIAHCAPAADGRWKYCAPILLDDIAVDFPNIDIIAVHMGYMAWREWANIAQFKARVHGDLSMWDLMAVSKPQLFRRYLREAIDIVGKDQILFGTDGPSFEPLVPMERWLDIIRSLTEKGTDGIVFTEEEVQAILGENAKRIFRL